MKHSLLREMYYEKKGREHPAGEKYTASAMVFSCSSDVPVLTMNIQ